MKGSWLERGLKGGSFFCGAGGDSQGTEVIDGVWMGFGANHWDVAIASWLLNHPGSDHYKGDIHDADLHKFPELDLFWASPECPQWSAARGKKRDFDSQPGLFDDPLPDEAADRSRALMWDVPKYLDIMNTRGRPVLAGVVENVIDVRSWNMWWTWRRSIENIGYRTWVIALNSMHAQALKSPWAPQSRNRLYVGYLHNSVTREPDWDKWLRPRAWCPACEQVVDAVKFWKKPGVDMGSYRTQYVYVCPAARCGGQIVEPFALPAAAAIDWDHLGTRVGDRAEPLRPKTIARIEAGLKRYARPITVETGGNTFERKPGVRTRPVDQPHTTQTATASKALAVPGLIVPTGGTWRTDAASTDDPMSTRTTRENDALATFPPFLVPIRSGRNRSMLATEQLATVVADGGNHGLCVPPFLTVHRGGEGDVRTQEVGDQLAAVVASGNHFGLAVPPEAGQAMIMRNNSSKDGTDPGGMCTPALDAMRALTATGHQSLVTWAKAVGHMLTPYYGNGTPIPATEPIGTVPTVDRWALASLEIDVNDVLFRMLEPGEIGAAMAFRRDYKLAGTSKRVKVRQYGNAVTPPVAEVIYSALVEAITGDPIERWEMAA